MTSGRPNFSGWSCSINIAATSRPFYSFLYSVHSQLPDFLINTHTVQDAADMRAYNARLRAIPAVLDTAIAESRLSDAAGIRAPRFAIERVIDGSKVITTGAPFDAGKDSPCGPMRRRRSASSRQPARSRGRRPMPCSRTREPRSWR